MKILMVCLGNICRSPIAEGVMQHLININNLDWQVDSAGTGSWHIDESPHEESIKICKTNGIDISSQRGRQFKVQDLNDYDIILAMDSENHRDILKNTTTKGHQDKVQLLLNYRTPGMNQAVPDPYYIGGFDKVFTMIDEACRAFVATHTT